MCEFSYAWLNVRMRVEHSHTRITSLSQFFNYKSMTSHLKSKASNLIKMLQIKIVFTPWTYTYVEMEFKGRGSEMFRMANPCHLTIGMSHAIFPLFHSTCTGVFFTWELCV